MTIKSSFGSVVLTNEDARKFQNQVIYGKPKAAAVEAVPRAKKLAEEMAENGHIVIKGQSMPHKEAR